MKQLLKRWLLADTIQQVCENTARLNEQQQLIDALTFFAADTCDTVNQLIARVTAIENKRAAVKTPKRRLPVKHK